MGFLDKVGAMVSSLAEGYEPFDPSKIDDPVAKKITWGPVKNGGTNIGTHALKRVSPERVEFRVRVLALLFPGIFMVTGLIIIATAAAGTGTQGNHKSLAIAIPFGLVFSLIGFFVGRSWMTPRVFDSRCRYYWKGRRQPVRGMLNQGNKDQCELADIHAIQLLSEYCRGNKRSYYSYELNLVLKDGRRINIVDHGKLGLIRRDAQQLGEFLGVPVWDAI